MNKENNREENTTLESIKRLVVLTYSGTDNSKYELGNVFGDKDGMVYVYPEYRSSIDNVRKIARKLFNDTDNNKVTILTASDTLVYELNNCIKLNHCNKDFKNLMIEKYNLGYICDLRSEDIESYTISNDTKTRTKNEVNSEGIHLDSWDDEMNAQNAIANNVEWCDSGFEYPINEELENRSICKKLLDEMSEYMDNRSNIVYLEDVREVSTIVALKEELEAIASEGSDIGFNVNYKNLKEDAYGIKYIVDDFINGEYALYDHKDMNCFWVDYITSNLVEQQ